MVKAIMEPTSVNHWSATHYSGEGYWGTEKTEKEEARTQNGSNNFFLVKKGKGFSQKTWRTKRCNPKLKVIYIPHIEHTKKRQLLCLKDNYHTSISN